MIEKMKNIIKESISVKERILSDEDFLKKVESVSHELVKAFKRGNKVLIAGNGGSAADAQHIAAELSGKFKIDRPPLDAEALHVNTSFLTAVANDYSYDVVFSRLIEAKGKKGDVFIGISTSGKSTNILKAFERAKEKGMTIIGFSGKFTEEFKKYCNYILDVPSDETPRVQEIHIMLGHIICELVEENIFNG